MTVQELIEQLEELDPELEVLVGDDKESNFFRSLDGDISVGHGERAHDEYEFTTEEYYEGPDGGDYPGDNCVVLWPSTPPMLWVQP